jgi:hypothetical protein
MHSKARSISFIDTTLCAAFSKGWPNALVICEEHEITSMPALLNIVPIFGYQVASDCEKAIQIYYETGGENILSQLVDTINQMISSQIDGKNRVDRKMILHYEKMAKHSFLAIHGENLASHFRGCGYVVEFVTPKEILQGAENFVHSSFFSKSQIFKYKEPVAPPKKVSSNLGKDHKSTRSREANPTRSKTPNVKNPDKNIFSVLAENEET